MAVVNTQPSRKPFTVQGELEAVTGSRSKPNPTQFLTWSGVPDAKDHWGQAVPASSWSLVGAMSGISCAPNCVGQFGQRLRSAGRTGRKDENEKKQEEARTPKP